MRKALFCKGLVVGIIMSLIGTSVVPSIGNIIEKQSNNENVYASIEKTNEIKSIPKPLGRDILFSDDFEDGTLNKWNVILGNWEVISEDGNHIAHLTRSSVYFRRMITKTAVTDNVIITAKVKGDADGDASDTGVGFYSDSLADNYYFIVLGGWDEKLTLYNYQNGVFTLLIYADIPIQNNIWYNTKIELINGNIYAKIWVVGTSEPSDWQISYNGATIYGHHIVVGGMAGQNNEEFWFDDISVTNQNPSEGLVGYWSFNDGTAHDDSGNNHDGTVVGATSTTGVSGLSFHFNMGDYIDVGNIGSNVNTMIYWVKPDYTITKNSGNPGTGNTLKTFIYDNSHGDNDGLGNSTALVQDETICITRGAAGEYRTAVLNQDITSDDWHMITYRWNTALSRYDIFFDNVNKPVTYGVSQGFNPLMTGITFRICDFNSKYEGSIDEVRIYNIALNDNQIQYLYENPGGGYEETYEYCEDFEDDAVGSGAMEPWFETSSSDSFKVVDFGNNHVFLHTGDGSNSNLGYWYFEQNCLNRIDFDVMLTDDSDFYYEIIRFYDIYDIYLFLIDIGYDDQDNVVFIKGLDSDVGFPYYEGNINIWYTVSIRFNDALSIWDYYVNDIYIGSNPYSGDRTLFSYGELQHVDYELILDIYFDNLCVSVDNPYVDDYLPLISISYPEEGITVYGTITITGIASDQDGTVTGVYIKIDDDGDWIEAIGTENWFYNWNTNEYSNGAHTIYARSKDNLNYYSEIASVSIDVFNGVNHPPIAYINHIYPDLAGVGEPIEFSGYGEDQDGNPIIEYIWWSSEYGDLYSGPSSTFSMMLPKGTYSIMFRVRDSLGELSNNIETRIITVEDGEFYRPGDYDYACSQAYPNSGTADAYANTETGVITAAAVTMWMQSHGYGEIGIYKNSDETRYIEVTGEYRHKGGDSGFPSGDSTITLCNGETGPCCPTEYCRGDPILHDFDNSMPWDLIIDLLINILGVIPGFPSWIENIWNLIDWIRTFYDAFELNQALQSSDVECSHIKGIIPLVPGDNTILFQLHSTGRGLVMVTGYAARFGQLSWVKVKDVDEPPEGQLSITAHSPVDLCIFDSTGRMINKSYCEIPAATYSEIDLNADGDDDDYIYIPNAIDGNYSIIVIPEEGAAPNATYSLTLNYELENNILAENISISDIPSEPYLFEAESVNPPLIQLIYPNGYEILNNSISIQWLITDLEDGNNLTTDIFYSNDYGENWSIISNEEYNDGEYEWNTTNVPDGTYMIRLETTDSNQNLRYQESEPFIINNNPAMDPDNTAPENPQIYGTNFGQTNISYTFSVTTEDQENDSIYYLINWGDDTNSGWLGPFISNETYNCTHIWNDVGIFNITIKAKDIYGFTSNWSTPLEIIINDLPPQIININANPSIQLGGYYVNITADITDNIQVNQVYLTIQYPDNFIENFSVTQNKTGNTYYCNRTYEQGLQYTYSIWANDTYGNANTSNSYNFLINNPPYTPDNLNPKNGETGIPVDTILSWAGGDPDIGDTVLYDVYFGTESPPPKVSSNQTNLQYHVYSLNINTTYYWMIIAWDTYSNSTAGPVWSFTTRTNKAPFNPSNPNPENGSIEVDLNAMLSWLSGDPDNDSVTYDVYFGLSSSPPKVASNITLTSYNPGELQGQKTYYWRIVAWDEFGSSSKGETWTFTTELYKNQLLLVGFIDEKNYIGNYISFKARFLFIFDIDNVLPAFLKSGEQFMISKEIQLGYIGEQFIVGIFEGASISTLSLTMNHPFRNRLKQLIVTQS